ncbi:GABA transporter 1-like isoform X2 [Salvia hispanica]|uniref:GABA transporter 1-like isoform X2 n=1 Tax=Salvia hispanica TaxID=49212 RepID=UPI002009342A|nr:GABA transporter 1-like isoform X2 [Salvia hispanica]
MATPTPPTHFLPNPSMQVASLGNNIAIQIAAGSSLKAVYKHYDPNGGLKLQHFIVFFGGFELALSQFPDIHSLRWLNALCTLSTIGFATTVIGVTVYSGTRGDRSMVTYGLDGSSSKKVFRRFNALGAIAFSFGDAMLPEIQSTVREPVKANMYKGVSSAYSVIAVTYWQIAFLGYWAFGAGVEPYIVASLTTPQWTLVVANLFAFVQILGCYQIYCRPTYAYFEGMENRLRGCVYRLVYTFAYVALITLVSLAMPFFGDFVSICGAVGFTPLDFVFPVVAYMKAGKMPRSRNLRLPLLLFNAGIAVWFSIVAVLGCVGAVRYIIQDTRTYNFFHDM